jgi:translation initiation factor IF-2
MPVRIYDISKKLGLENKEILAKAKAMGIAAAKVPSSSLDKISAEWLEEELFKTSRSRRQIRARPPPEPPKPAPVEEKIVLITAPPEPKPEVKVEPVGRRRGTAGG